MENLLKVWGLDNNNIHDVLKENQIDEKNIRNLTPELIAEMIPLIGPRMQFLEKWNATYGRAQNYVAESHSDTESIDSDIQETNGSRNKRKKQALERADAFTGKTSFALRTKSLNIRTILKKSMKGQAVLSSYKRTKKLSRKCRNIIVDVIVSEILAEVRCLKHEDFEHLATKIVELFPNELMSIYYVPPIKKKDSRSKKSITARGKLVDKYRNVIRQYKLLADCTIADNTSTDIDHSYPELEQSVIEHVSWLKQNNAPWEEVVSKWELTYAFRRREIDENRNLQIHAIFDSWPVLKHPHGYMLIEKDFSSQNLSKIENDFKTFNTFFTAIKSNCPYKKDDNSEALEKFLETDDLTEDTQVVLYLRLLPHIIPPKGRIRIKKNSSGNTNWKPSITECKDSILMHANVPGDVNRIQEEKDAVMKNFGLTVQPFIIVVGNSLHQLSTFYVSINKVLYKLPSALHALNVCFKAFHVLEATYPPESEHLWLLLQLALYKFSTKWDKPIPYIMDVVLSVSEYDKENSNADKP